MIDIKKIYIEVFNAIKNDTELLDLLEVKYEGVDRNTFLTNLRKQVIEGSSPDGLLKTYEIRLCVHERDGAFRGLHEDVGYLNIDIHISKDKNKINGVLSNVVKKVIEVLDTNERKKQGLQPLKVGLYGLDYKTRTFENRSNYTGWEKYSITFEYRYIL